MAENSARVTVGDMFARTSSCVTWRPDLCIAIATFLCVYGGSPGDPGDMFRSKTTDQLHLRAGNLLRTPEGKICILDFGMMTQVLFVPQNLSLRPASCALRCAAHDEAGELNLIHNLSTSRQL